MKHIHSVLAAASLAIATSAGVAADALTLAKDGQPNAMIVLPAGSTTAGRETALI